MQTCTPEGSQEEEVVVVVSIVATVDTFGDAEPARYEACGISLAK